MERVVEKLSGRCNQRIEKRRGDAVVHDVEKSHAVEQRVGNHGRAFLVGLVQIQKWDVFGGTTGHGVVTGCGTDIRTRDEGFEMLAGFGHRHRHRADTHLAAFQRAPPARGEASIAGEARDDLNVCGGHRRRVVPSVVRLQCRSESRVVMRFRFWFHLWPFSEASTHNDAHDTLHDVFRRDARCGISRT